MSLADGGHRKLITNLGKVRRTPDGKAIVSRPDDEDCVCCLPEPPPPPDSCWPASWVTGDYGPFIPFAGDVTMVAAGIVWCGGCFDDNVVLCSNEPYAKYIGGDPNGTWSVALGIFISWSTNFTGAMYLNAYRYSPGVPPDVGFNPCDPRFANPDTHDCDLNCPVENFTEGINDSYWELTCIDAATKRYGLIGGYQNCLFFWAQTNMVQHADGSATLTFHNTVTACFQPTGSAAADTGTNYYPGFGFYSYLHKTMATGGTVTVTFEAPP